MAKLDDEKRKKLKDEIHIHLRLTGPKEWDALMAKWSDVPRATFFRIVKTVRDEITEKAAADSPEALRVAQARVKSVQESLPAIQRETAKQLPDELTPSPGVVAKLGAAGPQHLSHMARFDLIWGDCMMMRSATIKVDDSGKESIKNLFGFEKAMRMALNVTMAQLEAESRVHNIDEVRTMYATVMEEIGKVSPDLQHAILLRLRALNNKMAMTVHADI